jgi:SNF2 family DNA or RNA helicase
MLIYHKISDDKYTPEFIGNDKEFNSYTYAMGQIPKQLDGNTWIFSKKGIAQLSNKMGIPSLDTIGDRLKLKPYEYQKEAVSEALSVDGGCLFSLPCGSGKTMVGICLFDELRKYNKIQGKGLIVVKATIKIQWPKEIERFSNYSASIVESYAACNPSRNAKVKQLKKQQKKLIDEDAILNIEDISVLQDQINEIEKKSNAVFDAQFDADLLVLNYETLADKMVLDRLKDCVDFIYADEIHVIKSPTAKRSKNLSELNSIKYTYGATATPIQKNPIDIYSIFRFLRPDLFPKLSEFKSLYVKYNSYGFPVGSRNEQRLHQLIRPYMVIKTPEEVAQELPELYVIQETFDLPPKQEEMTASLLAEIKDLKNQEEQIIQKVGSAEQARMLDSVQQIDAQIMACQTFAQELVDSEELLKVSESKLAKKYITGCKSTKLDTLLDIMDSILEANEKVCIFSKYRKMQPIMEKAIKDRFKETAELAFVNGTMTKEQQYAEWHDKFTVGNANVLIMSDAAAEGLSLGTCGYLIEFEPADSYLIQTQRRGRIQRADSTHRTVYVYQLIGINSYDEIALRIVNKKKKFMNTIVNGQEE